MGKKCSLVLPVKNGEMFIERILENVIPMLSAVDELIIVNDNSADQTSHLIQKYTNPKMRISMYMNQGDGLVDALNYGFKIATNPWIARVDADDIYRNDYLSIHKERTLTGVGVSFTDYLIEDNSALFNLLIPNPIFHFPIILSLVTNRRTPHPSAFLNKEIFDNCGGYVSESHPAEDLDLWFKIARISSLQGVDEAVLRYQRNEGSITYRKRCEVKLAHKTIIQEKNNSALIEKAFDEILSNYRAYLHDYQNFSVSNGRRFFLLYDLYKANLTLDLRCRIKVVRVITYSVCAYPGIILFCLLFLTKYIINSIIIRVRRLIKSLTFGTSLLITKH